MEKVWSSRPLPLAVVEVLEKKGPMTDDELLDAVTKVYGDLSFRELNRALMKLELGGIVRVSRLAKGKRRAELVEGRQLIQT
jgi:hypothetical protein